MQNFLAQSYDDNQKLLCAEFAEVLNNAATEYVYKSEKPREGLKQFQTVIGNFITELTSKYAEMKLALLIDECGKEQINKYQPELTEKEFKAAQKNYQDSANNRIKFKNKSDALEHYIKKDKEFSARYADANSEEMLDATATILAGLGIDGVAEVMFQKSFEPMLKRLVRIKEAEIERYLTTKDNAKNSGKAGGTVKAQREKPLVFYALGEYVTGSYAKAHSNARAGNLIKKKLNEQIDNLPSWRSKFPKYGEGSEAVRKWISNLNYYLQHGKHRKGVSDAVIEYSAKQYPKDLALVQSMN